MHWRRKWQPIPLFLSGESQGQRSLVGCWYSHLLKNFPQFFVIHTIKGLGVVSKAEVDVFLELSCFFNDPTDVSNLISGSSGFAEAETPILWPPDAKN